MTRRRLVAGNWKMHGSKADADTFLTELAQAGLPPDVDTLICPPFVYLPLMAQHDAPASLPLGGQTLCAHEGPGAYTGEVSATMLADAGASHVIVGHSERRALYGETDAVVATKFACAQAGGLTPVLCLGETLEQRESDATEDVLAGQLRAVVEACGVQALARAVIAYEPVWAIGTGRTATPEQAQAVHAFVRARIAHEDATIAESVQILYGGSVKPDNAAQLFAGEDVDGALVGGASLQADSFLAICRA